MYFKRIVGIMNVLVYTCRMHEEEMRQVTPSSDAFKVLPALYVQTLKITSKWESLTSHYTLGGNATILEGGEFI